MMGIRKKIMLGFTALCILLFFAGVVSVFEFERLSRNTQTILEVNTQNIEYSKQMLDAVQDQNIVLLQIAAFKNHEHDSLLYDARKRFSAAFNSIVELNGKKLPEIDSIFIADTIYNSIVNRAVFDAKDSSNINWFTDVYSTKYSAIVRAIKNFMISTQSRMAVDTSQLESNAYRAVMPGIIALAVAILLTLVFARLVDMYYLKPIIQIKKSLQRWLSQRIQYNVTVDGDSEMAKLNELIKELILMSKNRRTE